MICDKDIYLFKRSVFKKHQKVTTVRMSRLMEVFIHYYYLLLLWLRLQWIKFVGFFFSKYEIIRPGPALFSAFSG